ncbi:short chain dehydrogenase [Fusarium acutatum]|uniref:Short chain dehydrogenase n=1 Tax=Fusarium acutatum TaxID=78861 RepID=A0A8H4NIU7_9HYPO|nr:short chain dehydrogenase [Fusarium acutatum]
MNTSFYQTLPLHTFELLADSAAHLGRIDYFHYVRAFQRDIITILAIFGTVRFVGWALCASFFFHTYCLHRSKIHRYKHVSPDGSIAWALVTGASHGVGYEIVRELAGKGFNVVLHGRDEQDLLNAMMRMHEEFPDRNFKMLIADPTALGSKGFCYRKSYDDWKMERKLDIEAIKHELSKLNLTVLVNCANAEAKDTELGHILDENEKSIFKNINAGALYPIQLFRVLLPNLIGNAPSLIINVTSLSDKGIPLKISTSASRSFLSKMTESSALEMKLDGYDVAALCVRVSRCMGQADSTLARAIIARVGSRRSVFVGHWYQFLYKGLIDLLPGRL